MWRMLCCCSLKACSSCEGSVFRPACLEKIQDQLDTGDIVWLSLTDKNTAKFMLKAGAWKLYNRVGVLLRNGPGLENLQLCIPQDASRGSSENLSSSSSGDVRICNFADEVKSGLYKSIVITKTTLPLTPQEQQAAFTFCNKSIGEQRNQRVQMWISPNRKVFCNQLVADMLVDCGRVALVDNMYGPVKRSPASMLLPPLFISVQHNPCLNGAFVDSFSTQNRSIQMRSSNPAGQSTRSSHRTVHSSSEHQNEVFYSINSIPDEHHADVSARGAVGSDQAKAPWRLPFGLGGPSKQPYQAHDDSRPSVMVYLNPLRR